MKLILIVVLFHLLHVMLCMTPYPCTSQQNLVVISDRTSAAPCKTFDLSNVNDNTCVVIKDCLNDQLLVNNSAAINARKNVTITSPYTMLTIEPRDKNTACGIAFYSCQNIRFYNIRFRNCGAIYPHSNSDDSYTTVLYFEQTTSISLIRIKVENHHGLAISLIDCDDIIISELNVTSGTWLYSSGIFVYYTGLPNHSSSNHVRVEHSYFGHLQSESLTAEILRNPANLRSAFSVAFGKNTRNNKVEISGSYFENNNASKGSGSALLVTLSETSNGNNVNVIKSNFSSNVAKKFGGAVFVVSKSTEKNNGLINFSETNFTENIAEFGGAFFIWKAVEGFDRNHIDVGLSACIFSNNSASLGSDIVGVHTILQFEGGTTELRGNKRYNDKWLLFGSISLFKSIMLVRKTTVKCLNNLNSGIVLTNSTLQLNEGAQMIVANNRGVNGGGINICSRSFLIFNAGTHIQFQNNTAERKGGALYVLTSYIGFEAIRDSYAHIKSMCFVHTPKDSSHDTTFATFLNNNATDGNSIYATSLKRCTQDCSNIPSNWHFDMPPSEIATDPVNMISRDSSELQIFPGMLFFPKIIAQDEGGRNVSFDLTVSATNESVEIHRKRFIVKENKIPLKVNGDPKERIIFDLSFVATNEAAVTVQNLSLSNCPDFYTLNSQNTSCICEPKSCENFKSYVSQCFDDEGVYIYLDYWVEKSNIKAVHVCPRQYCRSFNRSETKNNFDILFDPEQQCREGRNQTSRLCSKCEHGWSVAFNTDECIKCHEGHPYIILIIFLYTLSVTTVIILFNRRVLTAFFNPIFYSYKLMDYFLKDLGNMERPVNVHLALLFDIVASVDLQGFFAIPHSYCFMVGMNNLNKLWLHFGLGILWIMSFILIYNTLNSECLIRRCACFKKISEFLPRDAYYRALNQLVFFVFIILVEFSFKVLHGVHIDGKLYVYNYADQLYLDGEHIALFAVAVICIVLNMLYILLLTINITAFKPNCLHTKLQRYSSTVIYVVLIAFKRGFKHAKNKEDESAEQNVDVRCEDCTLCASIYLSLSTKYFWIKESFSGEDCTVFAPIYLSLFTIFFGIEEFFPREDMFFVWFTVFLLVLFVYWRPYEKDRNNLIETMLLCNLIIIGVLINGVSGMFLHSETFLIVLCICIYWPIVGFVIYFLRTIIKFILNQYQINVSCCNWRPSIGKTTDEVIAVPLAVEGELNCVT